jgi:hypothetical protein
MRLQAPAEIPPTIVDSSVARTREYFTGAEVERLMAAARKSSRYGLRDGTMILIAYRHGLRASEVCDLQWHQVERTAGCMSGALLPGLHRQARLFENMATIEGRKSVAESRPRHQFQNGIEVIKMSAHHAA